MKNNDDGVYLPDITSYLEAGDEAHKQKHPDFHIIDFKDVDPKVQRKVSYRKLGFFQIVVSGNPDVDITVDGTKFKKMKEAIIFVAPDQAVSFDIQGFKKPSVGLLLVFSSDFLAFAPSNYNLLKNFPYFNMNRPPVYFLDQDQNTFFINKMKEINKCFQNLDSDNLELIKSHLTILLFEAKRMFMDGVVQTVANSRVEEITFQFETLITQTKSKNQKLEYYADKLNFSTIYLAECVKKATGKTAKRIITEYLMLESKSLLKQSTKTVNEISDQLGYEDTSNFISFFKKNAGSTPNQFRKHWKGYSIEQSTLP